MLGIRGGIKLINDVEQFTVPGRPCFFYSLGVQCRYCQSRSVCGTSPQDLILSISLNSNLIVQVTSSGKLYFGEPDLIIAS